MGRTIKISELNVGDIFLFGSNENHLYKCIYLGGNYYWDYNNIGSVFKFQGVYSEVTIVGRMEFKEDWVRNYTEENGFAP